MQPAPIQSAPTMRPPVAATIVLGGLAVLSALPALLSVMLFDAPGSEKNPLVVATVISMMSFPVLCVIAVVLAWVGYAARAPRLTARIVFLPLLGVAGVVVSMGLLSVLCGGRTRC